MYHILEETERVYGHMNEVMLAVTVLDQRSIITDTKTKGNESHHGR